MPIRSWTERTAVALEGAYAQSKGSSRVLINTDGTSGDAFGRLRVSYQVTIFDSQLQYVSVGRG